MSTSSLPVELWLEIFRWATLSLSTSSLCATTFKPFEAASCTEGTDHDTVAVKRTLVRVCRLWRDLARDLLFEDVVISRNAPALQQALESGGVGREKYRRIRRACLPYLSCTSYNYKDSETVATLLQACPELEILARPRTSITYLGSEAMTFDYPTVDCPSLRSLKRLDWWHYNEAARCGGYNALTEVLRAAPNLQYLSLGGDLWLNLMQRGSLELPALTTLRIRQMNVLFPQQVCRWSMPSLRNLIVDVASSPHLLDSFSERYGEQLKTIELGKHLRFFVTDIVGYVFNSCPVLEELGYFVMFTAIPYQPLQPHPTLTTLRWHAAPNDLLSSKDLWSHLSQHAGVFTRSSFPALKRIVLHGSWDFALGDERFLSIVKKLGEQGIEIQRLR